MPHRREAAKNASLREDEMPGVKRERIDAVGLLTLDEPASLNAMTPDLLGDLATAIREMTDEPDVRALVLTGAPRRTPAMPWIRPGRARAGGRSRERPYCHRGACCPA